MGILSCNKKLKKKMKSSKLLPLKWERGRGEVRNFGGSREKKLELTKGEDAVEEFVWSDRLKVSECLLERRFGQNKG